MLMIMLCLEGLGKTKNKRQLDSHMHINSPYWPWIKSSEPLLSSYPHYGMEHASVADLSVLAVAHLALDLKTCLG